MGELTRRRRWLIGMLAPIALVATTSSVALAATGSRPAVAAPRAVPACATSGLVVWLNTEGNGAAGSFYYTLELTNLSGHACTLGGFAGVSGVNLAGKQLGLAATRDVSRLGKAVTLKAGASATATLRITDTGVYSAAQCGQVTAAGLRVYPPGSTASKVVPFPFGACSTTKVPYLTIGALSSAGSVSTA